jgi:single-stranded DNA-binding protein
MNKCTFSGNLGDTPNFLVSANGTSVASFSLAVRKKKDKQPTWVKFKSFGVTAEIIRDYCGKGSFLIVEDAEYSPEQYENKEGEKKTWDGFIAHKVELTPKMKNSHSEKASAQEAEDMPF